jgi:hypothetical protein
MTMVVQASSPSIQEEEAGFEASLGYIVRPCQNKNEKFSLLTELGQKKPHPGSYVK